MEFFVMFLNEIQQFWTGFCYEIIAEPSFFEQNFETLQMFEWNHFSCFEVFWPHIRGKRMGGEGREQAELEKLYSLSWKTLQIQKKKQLKFLNFF